jgi:hypothetical protein
VTKKWKGEREEGEIRTRFRIPSPVLGFCSATFRSCSFSFWFWPFLRRLSGSTTDFRFAELMNEPEGAEEEEDGDEEEVEEEDGAEEDGTEEREI